MRALILIAGLALATSGLTACGDDGDGMPDNVVVIDESDANADCTDNVAPEVCNRAADRPAPAHEGKQPPRPY